jgi:hypothetical protein
MSQSECEAAVAKFIRNNRITRCPTVCLLATRDLGGLIQISVGIDAAGYR